MVTTSCGRPNLVVQMETIYDVPLDLLGVDYNGYIHVLQAQTVTNLCRENTTVIDRIRKRKNFFEVLEEILVNYILKTRLGRIQLDRA